MTLHFNVREWPRVSLHAGPYSIMWHHWWMHINQYSHYNDIIMSAKASQITFRPKKTPKLCVTGLCEGNSPVTSEFPAQRASNAENVSIWWRHHDLLLCSRNIQLNIPKHGSGVMICTDTDNESQSLFSMYSSVRNQFWKPKLIIDLPFWLINWIRSEDRNVTNIITHPIIWIFLTFYLQHNFKRTTWENIYISVKWLWFFLLCIYMSEIPNSNQWHQI